MEYTNPVSLAETLQRLAFKNNCHVGTSEEGPPQICPCSNLSVNPHLFGQISVNFKSSICSWIWMSQKPKGTKSSTNTSALPSFSMSCEAGGDAWPNSTFGIFPSHNSFVQVLSSALKMPSEKSYTVLHTLICVLKWKTKPFLPRGIYRPGLKAYRVFCSAIN